MDSQAQTTEVQMPRSHGKKAQWVRVLLSMHEELSWDPQHPNEKLNVDCAAWDRARMTLEPARQPC